MKICFLARPSFDVFSSELYKGLKKIDSEISGVFITTNAVESQNVRSYMSKNNDVEIYETSVYLKKHWNEFSLDKLKFYEKEYDCKPIWEYIYTDRFLINREYEYVVKITAGLFSFYEHVFEETKPDFYYSECIATLQCYIGYIVGRSKGVKYVAQMCARGNLDSTYHYFVHDPYQLNSELDNNYLSIDYSDEEKERAERYLMDFENKDSKPPAMQFVKTKPKIDKEYIFSPIRYIKGRIDPLKNDPYSYMYFRSYERSLNPIVFYHRYQKLKKYFKDPDYSQKYIFFPLHYQPEGSTCVCAKKYEKQLFFIDGWAKSLPADTVLYVKEHYTLLVHKELSFYKELRKYPNVVLINPWVNSRKLIENAVAVTTLTGTAGYEAMLLRKPVFIGGNSVYWNAPGVVNIKDVYGNYLELISNWKKPERDETIKYICALFRSFHKGNAYCQNYPELIKDNIDLMADSLYKKLKDLYSDV